MRVVMIIMIPIVLMMMIITTTVIMTMIIMSLNGAVLDFLQSPLYATIYLQHA